MTVKKLTPDLLRKIIEEEVSKSFGDMKDVEKEANKTDETDADELADSLEHPVDWNKAGGLPKQEESLERHIDYVKALKVEESRLLKRVQKLRETRQRVLKKIANNIA